MRVELSSDARVLDLARQEADQGVRTVRPKGDSLVARWETTRASSWWMATPPIRNHYGSKSLRGTEVAALFCSLIETARLRGEDPGRYLLRAALAAIDNPGTVTLPSGSD